MTSINLTIPEEMLTANGTVTFYQRIEHTNGAQLLVEASVTVGGGAVKQPVVIASKRGNWKDLSYEQVRAIIKEHMPLKLRKTAARSSAEHTKLLNSIGLPGPVSLYNHFTQTGDWQGYQHAFSYTSSYGKKKPTKVKTKQKDNRPKPTRQDMERAFEEAGLGKPTQFANPPSWEWLKELIDGLIEMKRNRGEL